MIKIPKVKKIHIVLIVLIVLTVLVFVIFDKKGSKDVLRFSTAYNNYDYFSDVHENATYTPGAQSNDIRIELDRILAIVLTGNISNEERLKLSKSGISMIKKLESQIDAIGDAVDPVGSAISGLEESASQISNTDQKESSDKLIDMANKKVEIISDIRGLSYRANYYTSEIFKRIIKDKGRLTEDHIKYLNDKIPEVEEQFDRRSNLYDQLDDINNDMDVEYINFENSL